MWWEWGSSCTGTRPRRLLIVPQNVDVVRPYLVGEDLNGRPDASPSRWVIDFRDWPEERARTYEQPFGGSPSSFAQSGPRSTDAAHRERWWQFGDKRPLLYRTIDSLERCIAITLVSKVLQPMFVPTGIVYAHKLGVFAYDDDGHFGLLSSGFHWSWAVAHTSTLGAAPNYSPTDAFETFRPAGAYGWGWRHRRRTEYPSWPIDAGPPGGSYEDLQSGARPRREGRRYRAPSGAPRTASTTPFATHTAGPISTSATDSTKRSLVSRFTFAPGPARRCSTGCWSSITIGTRER